MDKVEKIDCRANGEVISCAMSLLLRQNPKIRDPISQKVTQAGKEVTYPITQMKNSDSS